MKPKPANCDDALSLRSIALCGLVLGFAVIVVFGDIMIAGDAKLLSKDDQDVATQELGRHIFNFNQLAHGNFPLWCPSQFCGYPSFGGMQTGLLYPLNFPYVFASKVMAINWSFIIHVFLGGMFMYLWLGRQSLHRLACLSGAIMFAFCAPFFLRIYAGHLTPHNTIAWIPLVFLAIEAIIATPTFGWFLLGTGAVSMQLLAGYPQVLFYTAIAAALYTLTRIHESPKLWKSVVLLLLMNVFVLGLTCVQWSAGVAVADQSVRSGGVPYEFAASFSLPIDNWLTLIQPGIFGDMKTLPYWGRWYLWEMCLFFGVVGFFFSFVGLFHPKRRRVFAAAGMVLAMGVLATGAYSPHFRFFYDHVPGFNMFRSNSKFSILTVLFLIFLSAHGLDFLFRARSKRILTGMFFGATVGCVAVATMAVVARFCPADRFKAVVGASLNSGESYLKDSQKFLNSPETIAAAAKFAAGELAEASCFLGALAVVLGMTWRRPQWRAFLALIVVGLIGAELLFFARSMTVSFSPAVVFAPLHNASLLKLVPGRQPDREAIPDLKAFLRQNLGDGRIFSPDGWNTALLMDGVSDLWGYGPVSPVRRYAEFLAFTQGGNPDELTGSQDFKQVHRRFDMLRCKYILITQPDRSIAVVPALEFSPLPKFSLVTDWWVDARRDSVLNAICSKSFNPRASVVLERRPAGWAASGGNPFGDVAGTIRILGESTDWQELEVTLDKPAILLETDLYTPNWHVRGLPGSAQSDYELIPANYILRGVPLTAGKHRLRIEYRPTEFIIGKWVSWASLIAFVTSAILWVIGRRKSHVEQRLAER